MILVLFEDDRVADLYPITLGRAAYAITCGSYRLIDIAARLCPKPRGVVRPHLSTIERLNHASIGDPLPDKAETIVLLNARLVPSMATLDALEAWLDGDQPGRAEAGGTLLADTSPFEILPLAH